MREFPDRKPVPGCPDTSSQMNARILSIAQVSQNAGGMQVVENSNLVRGVWGAYTKAGEALEHESFHRWTPQAAAAVGLKVVELFPLDRWQASRDRAERRVEAE